MQLGWARGWLYPPVSVTKGRATVFHKSGVQPRDMRRRRPFLNLAEREGFEPSKGF